MSKIYTTITHKDKDLGRARFRVLKHPSSDTYTMSDGEVVPVKIMQDERCHQVPSQLRTRIQVPAPGTPAYLAWYERQPIEQDKEWAARQKNRAKLASDAKDDKGIKRGKELRNQSKPRA